MNEPRVIVGDVKQKRFQRVLRKFAPKSSGKKEKDYKPGRRSTFLLGLGVVALVSATIGAYTYFSYRDKRDDKSSFEQSPTTAPENLIKFDPNDEQQKQLENAYGELLRRADSNQATYDEYLQVAGIFQQQGDDRKALRYYELALTKISPGDPQAQTKRDRINLIITEIRKRLG